VLHARLVNMQRPSSLAWLAVRRWVGLNCMKSALGARQKRG